MALPKIEVEVRADTKSATASLDAFVKELDQVGQAGETAGKDIDELKRNFDRLRGSIDPVYSSSKNYERAVRTVSAAVKSGAVSQGEANRVLKLAEAQYLTTGRSAQVMGTQVRGANHHATNMMFQFQDIGMMLASGQSPFLLALQQGTQVTGIMQQMRMEGQSAFKAITGGIMGMINPMSIATLGIIAGGAALGQWALSAISAGEEADDARERFEDLESAISALGEVSRASASDISVYLGDAFAGVSKDVQALIDDLREAEFSLISRRIRNEVEAATSDLNRLGGAFEVFWEEFSNPGSVDSGYLEEINKIIAKSEMTYDEFLKLEKATKAVFEANSVDQFISRLAAARSEAERIGGPVGEKVAASLLKAAEDAGVLNRLLTAASGAAEKAADSSGNITSELADATNQALKLRDALNAASAASLSRADQISVLKGQISAAERGASTAAAKAAAETAISLGRAGASVDQIAGAAQKAGEEAKKIEALKERLGELTSPTKEVGRGGGGRADPNAARIQSLIESLKTEREILEEWRVEGMELLREANAQELEALGGHNEAKLRLEQEYQERLAQLQGQGRNQQLKDAGSFFGAMASAIQQGGGKAVKAAQVLAAAQGLINSYLAYTEVLKDPSFVGRPWARLAAAASVLGAGLNMVQAIKGVSSSGASGGGATSTAGAAQQSQPRRQSVTNITLQGEIFSRESVQELLVEQLQGEIDRGGRVVFSS